MSEEEDMQVSLPPPPTEDDHEAWKTYWEARGQPWRTEPEISTERKAELTQCRTNVAHIQRGLSPFKGRKLCRSDVEWLLATHDNGRGPVDWSDEKQRQREGLNLRGADLMAVDLHGLPLSCLQGGLTEDERRMTTEEQRADIVVNLRKANLDKARLEGSNLQAAQLEGASLRKARLQGALLREAKCEGAVLAMASLEGADLREARLEETYLSYVILGDKRGIGPQMVDVRWGATNLAVVDWSPVKTLGDERSARQTKEVSASRRAVRANRQLAVALQDQGLNEDAARFAYRAQRLQRILLRQQHKFGQYLFSWLLDLIAGYGYRPGRSMCWYLVLILGFALAYHVLGGLSLFPPDAFIYSLTSFHGRGFFPGLEHTTSLHDPLIMLASFEAVIGLLIEISFIATFTQRFFGK